MPEFKLQIQITGEVRVNASSVEEAQTLLDYAAPSLSGAQVIKSGVKIIHHEKVADVSLAPDDLVVKLNTTETKH